MKNGSSEKLTKDQRAHLQSRLKEAFNNHRYNSRSQEKEPAEVKKARLVIERHNDQEQKDLELRTKVIQKERNRLEEILLFSTPEKALAEIKKFETMEFKR